MQLEPEGCKIGTKQLIWILRFFQSVKIHLTFSNIFFYSSACLVCKARNTISKWSCPLSIYPVDISHCLEKMVVIKNHCRGSCLKTPLFFCHKGALSQKSPQCIVFRDLSSISVPINLIETIIEHSTQRRLNTKSVAFLTSRKNLWSKMTFENYGKLWLQLTQGDF